MCNKSAKPSAWNEYLLSLLFKSRWTLLTLSKILYLVA
jgi:hypothetical protein